MRHQKKRMKIGEKIPARRALIRSLCINFLLNGKIQTTKARAKVIRMEAEKLITIAKKNSLTARRLLLQKIDDRKVAKKLIEEIAPRYVSRSGGYTRIIHLGKRVGDAAEVVIIELV